MRKKSRKTKLYRKTKNSKKSLRKTYKKSRKIINNNKKRSRSYRKHSQKIKYINGGGYISELKEQDSCYIRDFDDCIYGKSKNKNKIKGKGSKSSTRKCKYNLKNQICQPA
jgi:hypothetical protein